MLCWGEGMRVPGRQEDPIPAARLHRPHELPATQNRAAAALRPREHCWAGLR